MMSWNKSCMSWHPLKEWDNKSEGKRLVFACHLSSSLTLGLITASPLANAPSLGTGSMCNLHKRWEICTKTLAGAIMGSENLSGAKGNSHSQLNAHFAFLSVWNLCIIHHNNVVLMSGLFSKMEGPQRRPAGQYSSQSGREHAAFSNVTWK